MIKSTILVPRDPALTHDQVVEHHASVHAAPFMSVPAMQGTVARYLRRHAIAAEHAARHRRRHHRAVVGGRAGTRV